MGVFDANTGGGEIEHLIETKVQKQRMGSAMW